MNYLTAKNSKQVFTAVGVDGLINLLSNVPSLSGAREALELGMGAIVADRMEMAFKGIDKTEGKHIFKMNVHHEELKTYEDIAKVLFK